MTPTKFTNAYVEALPRVGVRRLEHQKQRLLQERIEPTSGALPVWLTRFRVLQVATLVFVACACAVWLGPWRWSGSGPAATLAAEWVNPAGSVPVGDGQRVDNQHSGEDTVRFSEGSQLRVGTHTSLTVDSLRPQQASLTLEGGSLRAKIQKHTGIQWTIAAGQHRVRVVGTEFTVAWNVGSGKLRVEVQSGAVRVEGGSLGVDGILVTAGGAFEVDPTAPSESLGHVPEPEPVAEDALAEPALPTPREHTNATSAAAVGHVTRGWQRLAGQRKYGEAFAALGDLDTDQLIRSLDARGLLQLGNVARLGGGHAWQASTVATQAYEALRTRFPKTQEGAVAAFALGRLIVDRRGSPERAAHWFEAYLRDATEQSLAEGARSRLMQIYVQTGNLERARATAREYLRHHPQGKQAATAQRLARAQVPKGGERRAASP